MMMNNEELKEYTIQEMIKAGARFSRHLRNAWTGERLRSNLSASEFTGRVHYLQLIATLPIGSPLIDWADVADLNQFYMGTPDQHTWDAERWEKEIRQRVKPQ